MSYASCFLFPARVGSQCANALFRPREEVQKLVILPSQGQTLQEEAGEDA
jgi:hypothetical protein